MSALVTREPRSRHALKLASRAIAEAIEAIVEEGAPGRFAQIERLSRVGRDIEHELARRIADFAANEPVGNVVMQRMPLADDDDDNAPRVGGGLPDITRLIRESMMHLEHATAVNDSRNEADVALREADELQRLLTLMRLLPRGDKRGRAALQSRIDALIHNIEVRSNHAVVSADVQRGHPARAEGGEGDDAAGLFPDADGAEGDGGTA